MQAFHGYGSDYRVTRYRAIKKFGLEILHYDAKLVEELIELHNMESEVEEEMEKRAKRKTQSDSLQKSFHGK
jgi:hypothetical protein